MSPSSTEMYWWGEELVRGEVPPRLDEARIVELKLPAPFSDSLRELLERAGWRMVVDERDVDGTEYVRFRHDPDNNMNAGSSRTQPGGWDDEPVAASR